MTKEKTHSRNILTHYISINSLKDFIDKYAQGNQKEDTKQTSKMINNNI